MNHHFHKNLNAHWILKFGNRGNKIYRLRNFIRSFCNKYECVCEGKIKLLAQRTNLNGWIDMQYTAGIIDSAEDHRDRLGNFSGEGIGGRFWEKMTVLFWNFVQRLPDIVQSQEWHNRDMTIYYPWGLKFTCKLPKVLILRVEGGKGCSGFPFGLMENTFKYF